MSEVSLGQLSHKQNSANTWYCVLRPNFGYFTLRASSNQHRTISKPGETSSLNLLLTSLYRGANPVRTVRRDLTTRATYMSVCRDSGRRWQQLPQLRLCGERLAAELVRVLLWPGVVLWGLLRAAGLCLPDPGAAQSAPGAGAAPLRCAADPGRAGQELPAAPAAAAAAAAAARNHGRWTPGSGSVRGVSLAGG